jgi:hypothetical protein
LSIQDHVHSILTACNDHWMIQEAFFLGLGLSSLARRRILIGFCLEQRAGMRTFILLAFRRRDFHDRYTRYTAGLISFLWLRDVLLACPALAP